MKKNKNLILSVLAVLTVILITAGVTYAFFNYAKEGTTDNVITTGSITFLYTEVSGVGNGINIENAFPISEEVGKVVTGEGEYFDFKITSTTENNTIPYEVTARKSTNSDDIDESIRVYLTKGEEEVLLDNYSNLTQTSKVEESKYTEKVIYTDTVPANSNYEESFRFRMWIAEDTRFDITDMNNKTFTLTVNVYANAEVVTGEETVYKETLLNGADPVLTTGASVASNSNVVRLSTTEENKQLVPVIIDNTGKVTKANINEKWYSYENKEWANAVILEDYNITYEDGDEILESNIESYFVWIPRYRYELFAPDNYNSVINSKPTTSNAKPINIIFESKETSVSDGTNNWLTHPAFTAFDTNGIWIGKFETGFDGATSTLEAQTNTNISDRSKVIIKPNVYSWRNINVSNMFTTSLAYNTTLNSHMMKNTEWGAVAYLSHSIYGINTEVRINNNSNYITGYSSTDTANQSDYPGTYGTSSDVTLVYNTETGYKASTTGNISGIYDMSGGAHEYMSAYMSGLYKSSGFTSTTISQYDTKYFDIYPSNSTQTSYANRILGDATGEMGSFYYYKTGNANFYHNNWYADLSFFTDSNNPWVRRGGGCSDGLIAGQFNFSRSAGGIASDFSFRIVLAP